jgi:hypothetical protein
MKLTFSVCIQNGGDNWGFLPPIYIKFAYQIAEIDK